MTAPKLSRAETNHETDEQTAIRHLNDAFDRIAAERDKEAVEDAEPIRTMPNTDTQPQHTAGPWSVDGFNTAAVIAEIAPRRFVRVAVTETDHMKNPNWKADAALIAQAPALLAERDALRAALDAIVEAGRMSDQSRALYCADIARAALAPSNPMPE